MPCSASWPTVAARLEEISDEVRLFFTEHEWQTVEAATARIIPTDHQPGALEAGVVCFIDRYLSGIEYVYASADGSGFLRMDGRIAEDWRQHIRTLQSLYCDGLQELDRISDQRFGAGFIALDEPRQNEVLVAISGAPEPEPLKQLRITGSGYGFALQSDRDLDFFSTLCLHTRQGFYCDPVYGGNRDRVGWKVIGFPGPDSLADTQTCAYTVEHLLVHDCDWAELIPHLREQDG